MKTKITTIVGMALVVLGAIFGVTTDAQQMPEIVGLATVLLGAGASIFGLWKTRDPQKPKWMGITTISLVAVGAIVTGISGFNDASKLGDILGTVITIVSSIIGFIVNKKKPAIEVKK